MRTAACLVLLTACGGAKPAAVTVEPLPSATQVAPARLPKPDVTAFFTAGCKPTNDASLIDCTAASIPGVAKCRSPLHLLDVQLEPPAIVAECFVTNATGGIRQTGCMMRSATWLVVRTADRFVILETAEALSKTFAPVTSRDSAIAFAVVTSGSQWIATAHDHVGPSSVHELDDGFHVELFAHQVCGCAHPTWSIEYLVSRAGEVRELSRKVVWEDPKMNGLCVD